VFDKPRLIAAGQENQELATLGWLCGNQMAAKLESHASLFKRMTALERYAYLEENCPMMLQRYRTRRKGPRRMRRSLGCVEAPTREGEMDSTHFTRILFGQLANLFFFLKKYTTLALPMKPVSMNVKPARLDPGSCSQFSRSPFMAPLLLKR
jgi:hypothetical protein